MDALLSTGAIPAAATSYDIDNSLKFESDNGERFQSTNLGTHSSGGNQKWTLSCWVKRTEISTSSNHPGALNFQTNTGITVSWQFCADSSNEALFQTIHDSTMYTYSRTKAVFKDTAAWYHCMWVVDSTESAAADRSIVYVNGVRQELEAAHTSHPLNIATQNQTFPVQSTHYIGGYDGGNNGFRGYIADYYYLDGIAASPTDFGKYDTNGVWVAKAYGGSFGNCGYFLEFQDSSNLGKDTGPNTHGNFNHYGGSAQDQATDTPTNNFCTMNINARTNGNIRTQEGGTFVTTDGGSGWCSMLATMAVGSGKWYWEAKVWDNSDALTVYVGIAATNDPYVPHSQGGYYLGNVETTGSMGWYLSDGSNKNQAGSWGNPARGDKLMFAWDADNYKLYYGINGTWGNSSNPATGSNGIGSIDSYWMSAVKDALTFVAPAVTVYQGKGMKGFNFGGYCGWTIDSGNTDANGYGNFEYAPPSGFYALCSKNLAQYGG